MTIPQWEACKVCGGDHWTKDHTTLEGHRICEENMDAEIARQAAEIATLRAQYAAQLNLTIEANSTIAALRAALLGAGGHLPEWEHWRVRATSKPSDPDDIRWDCACGYAGSPDTVRKHWTAMGDALTAAKETP